MNPLIEIRDFELSVDECFRAVQRPAAGGIALFVGVVRDHSEGKRVTQLEYQAYASMAEKELRLIFDEIEREWPGTKLACQHRVGPLDVGGLAVVCAASAPHRAEAFEACRALIDRLKQRVPVWKREHDESGPHWVGWQDVRL